MSVEPRPHSEPQEYVVPTTDELIWALEQLRPAMTSLAFDHYERLWAYIHHSHAMIEMNGRLQEQLEAAERTIHDALYCLEDEATLWTEAFKILGAYGLESIPASEPNDG